MKENIFMEDLRVLSDEECKNIKGGEAITLTGVMAILAIAIVAVICYRFFVSAKGDVTLPGGFVFKWGK